MRVRLSRAIVLLTPYPSQSSPPRSLAHRHMPPQTMIFRTHITPHTVCRLKISSKELAQCVCVCVCPVHVSC